MRTTIRAAFAASAAAAILATVGSSAPPAVTPQEQALSAQILADPNLPTVLTKAKTLVSQAPGGASGSQYPEVWIRDFNTWLPLYFDAGNPREPIAEILLKFVGLQEANGSIPDGYTIATGKPFKNTVETDQETSLVQAFHTYLARSGDWGLLDVPVVFNGRWSTVRNQLLFAMDYLWRERTSADYLLLWGGTTVDWGDVEMFNTDGTQYNAQSYPSLDVYDNAMYAIALDNLSTWPGVNQSAWKAKHDALVKSIRRWLWDGQRYRAHVYLWKGSPFPPGFDESQVNNHGGTAVAIQAGLLTDAEVDLQRVFWESDRDNARAQTIGVNVYPYYAPSFFPNPMCVNCYQNGADWDWFGARQVMGLVNRDPQTAYRLAKPIIDRVAQAGDFCEWWDLVGNCKGARGFKGAAGVDGMLILKLQGWARAHQ